MEGGMEREEGRGKHGGEFASGIPPIMERGRCL